MAEKKQFCEPVQLLAFVLQRGPEWDAALLEKLEETWGAIRHKGKLFAFDKTDYYEPEMGAGLYRGVLSFEKCIPAETIALEKARSNEFELAFADAGPEHRCVNIAKGEFHPTAWAFDDFKRNPYQHDLQLIRERWRKSVRGK